MLTRQPSNWLCLVILFSCLTSKADDSISMTVVRDGITLEYQFMDLASKQQEPEFTEVLTAGFKHYSSLFGGLPRDLEGNPYKDITLHINHGTLGGEADPKFISLTWNNDVIFGYGTWQTMLLHELFHLWNAESFRYADGSEQWFNEGFTEYFAINTATQLGHIEAEEALSIAALPIGYYSSARNLGKLALREVGRDSQLKFENYFLLYHGGWTLAMLLDEDLREKSDGKVDLTDLMQWLYVNYPRHLKLYDMEDIAKGLKVISGNDYTPLLLKYVDGKETIPVMEYYNVSDALWSYKFNHKAKPAYQYVYQTLGIAE